MKTASTNVLQRLMQKWESVHPYNAAQLMKIQGQPDLAALDQAWQQTMETTGLGRVILNQDNYRFESLNGDAASFGVQLIDIPLTQFLSDQLNRPFNNSVEPPFRPFVLRAADHFFAGLIYQHWLADSVSIRMLLREWFTRLYDPAAAQRKPLALAAVGYWKTIGPARAGWHLGESTLSTMRRHARMRRVQKIDSAALTNYHTRFEMFPTPPGLIQQLRALATCRKVKLNDVFMAALIEACARHVPLQPRPNRKDIAVGSVVDLRPFCRGSSLSDTFGLFLGFTNVICQPDHLQNFDRLLRAVAGQTRIQKSTGVAPSSLMWMSAALTIGKLSRPDELYHFYRKELPLAGGISNVNMSNTWAARYHPLPLMEYIRVSPTGPMTPLVVTTTTLGETFNVGITHRTGLICPQRTTAIAQTFLERLNNLHGC